MQFPSKRKKVVVNVDATRQSPATSLGSVKQSAKSPETASTDALLHQLNKLPVELLLEISGYFTSSCVAGRLPTDDDESRSRAGYAFLHMLMTSSRRFRAIARPIYWQETRIVSKARWLKLKGLTRSNKFKKTVAVLDPTLIRVLDIELERVGEAYGGLDDGDLAEMAASLTSVRHLRVRLNEQTRLSKAPRLGGPRYLELLSRFGQINSDGGPPRLTQLSIVNVQPEPLGHVLQMLTRLPHLEELLLDNISSSPPHDGVVVNANLVQLTNLASFTLRNSPTVTFSNETGFNFLFAAAQSLRKLVLRDVQLDAGYVESVIDKHSGTLTHLELGTAAPPSVMDRDHLARLEESGQWSYDTGFHYPLAMLEVAYRIGNEAANLCEDLTFLALGGSLCVSADLFEVLAEPTRRPLHTLRIFNAWPMRPLRPQGDRDSAREKELLAANPSGICPDDVLAALQDGFKVSRLQLQGMGVEWDLAKQESAANVQVECAKRGIEFAYV